jgi:predicted permease
MLGILGGVLGLLLSLWGVRMFALAVAGVGKPYWIKFTMDYAVFGYLAAISVGTGILFGLAPALHTSKVDINETLKEGGRGTSGGSRARYLSAVLVIGQLALALVLLAGAGLMIRSFMKVYGMDLGFNRDNILTARFALDNAKYPTPESRAHFHELLLPRLASVPGVESVALVSNLPQGGAPDWQFELEGQAPVEREKLPAVSGLVISPDYFRVLGVQLVVGRAFHASDGLAGKTVVIVNQKFASKYFPKADPVGRRLRLVRDTQEAWLTVVGVCPDIRQGDPQKVETDAILYVPYRQDPQKSASILTRTKVASATLSSAFRKEVQALDPDLPLYQVSSMREFLATQQWAFLVFGSLFTSFAIIALVLASVGIYAVMSYSVSQRTQEIGIRMALGASTRSIVRLVLSRGMKQLAIGLAVGLAMALAVGRVLTTLLVQITPTDPVTFTSIVVLLAAVGIFACWMPARRAVKVDPLVALRYE